MEQKLDLIMEMLKDMNGKLTSMDSKIETIDSRLERVEVDLSSVKRDVEFTKNHLVGVDERLTMTEKIKKLYSEEALKAVEAV